MFSFMCATSNLCIIGKQFGSSGGSWVFRRAEVKCTGCVGAGESSAAAVAELRPRSTCLYAPRAGALLWWPDFVAVNYVCCISPNMKDATSEDSVKMMGFWHFLCED